MTNRNFELTTKQLIDDLKAICARFGLGNDGNEFKIITQVFLYKFMNDKFGHEVRKIEPKLENNPSWVDELKLLNEEDYKFLMMKLPAGSATFYHYQLITSLFNRQNEPEFGKLFDDTLRSISQNNNEIFAVRTDRGARVQLFDELTQFIADSSRRDDFAKAIINQLVTVDFSEIFHQKYDFFSTIFEYLIKDYNIDSGGKYAEYYTPHAVARIMARILVDKQVSNVTVYDPSAGSGTLLMSVAHQIGEDKCTIYSQDISQKSSNMLRLNLILNNLVDSLIHIIQGNTLLDPYHKDGENIKKFDYIVSNPPFKLDFSEYRDQLDAKINRDRFFAGVPNIPKSKKESMAIYLLFLQHIVSSLSDKGKAAIVVPSGFLTAQTGIERRIREYLISKKLLRGVVSMPSNIFAKTGTNVSVIFVEKGNEEDKAIFMDASKLGQKIKLDGKNERTVLDEEEEKKIVTVFNNKELVDDFSVIVDFDKIIEKNYSFAAGQYFDLKILYSDMSAEDFAVEIKNFEEKITEYSHKSRSLAERS